MSESGVWREPFRLRSYETDPAGQASIATICNYLQEVAGNHAFRLGLSVEHLHERRLTWVLARLRVLLDRYPRWRDEVFVETWPSGIEGLLGTRDFLLLDEGGRRLGRATSGWMIIDVDRRRPVRMPESVTSLSTPDRERALPELSAGLPDAASDRIDDRNSGVADSRGHEDAGENVAERGSTRAGGDNVDDRGGSNAGGDVTDGAGFLDGGGGHNGGGEPLRSPVRVEYADLDVNGHVNNVRYVEWALETMGAAHHDGHEVAELEIHFKSEAVYGDAVDVRTARILDENPQPHLSAFSHVILKSGSQRELARLRTIWRSR